MKHDNYAKACTEVLMLIPYIDKQYSKKISSNFISLMKEISDKEYTPDIDINKKIKEQKLLKETRAILALIYRDYICTKEERETLLLQEKEESERIEKEKQEKYNIDFEKIAEKRREKSIIEKVQTESQNALIEVQEEKWYKKIISKILNFFKRK